MTQRLRTTFRSTSSTQQTATTETPRRALALSVLRRAIPGLVVVTLLAALWAGLYRLGWAIAPLAPTLPSAHGSLMVGGFLGALISLERAAAVPYRWAYLAPLTSVAGALLGSLGLAAPIPALLVTLGSLVFLAVLIGLWRTVPAFFTATIALGGLCWLIGNVLWLSGAALPTLVYWWATFLVLTIAGERLELSRMLRLSTLSRALFAGVLGVLLVAGALTLVRYTLGARLFGAGLVLLALWLWRYDIARRRLRAGGQARYMAAALLSGYVWMAVSGLLALRYGGITAGPQYDALLHSLFVGFVLSMIFAHALIILPVLSGRAIRYTSLFYVPLGLLHLTLVLRVGGDLIPFWPARLWGGLLNVVVIFLFAGLLLSRRAPAQPAGEPRSNLPRPNMP